MAASRLPEFMIIGAAKAATTWLSFQLRHHPALFLPAAEPHFFSTEYDRGRDWYLEQFRDAAPDQIIGEKSADYLAHPDTARRIAEWLPNVRLIVQLRNPIERAYSDYCMLYRRGTVAGDPRPYFHRTTTPQPRFLEDGLYRQHLERFFTHFPRDQITVILHEDIHERPLDIIAEVCRHIGVPPPEAPAVMTRVNGAEAPLLPLGVRRTLRPLKPIAAPLRGQPWFEAMRAPFARPVEYPQLGQDLQQQLREFYAEDITSLSQLLGRDLSPWLADRQGA